MSGGGGGQTAVLKEHNFSRIFNFFFYFHIFSFFVLFISIPFVWQGDNGIQCAVCVCGVYTVVWHTAHRKERDKRKVRKNTAF